MAKALSPILDFLCRNNKRWKSRESLLETEENEKIGERNKREGNREGRSFEGKEEMRKNRRKTRLSSSLHL